MQIKTGKGIGEIKEKSVGRERRKCREERERKLEIRGLERKKEKWMGEKGENVEKEEKGG